MAKTIRFKPEHILSFKEHVHGISVGQNITVTQLENLAARSHSYSIVEDKDGKEEVLGCAGVTEYWEGRGEVWAVLRQDLGMDFVKVHSEVKKFLDAVPIKRLEAVVDDDFRDGQRWVRALGFHVEAPLLKCYGRSGKDCVMFTRIRNDVD